MGPLATGAGAYAGQYVGKRVGKRIGKVFGSLAGDTKKGGKAGKEIGGFVGKVYGAVGGNLVPILGSFCKGGTCNKTGAYIIHKGEYIVSNKMKKKCSLCKKKARRK